ncbi:MAG: T9SS type A sorting domain-containing protein [Bacteroidales bacterium]|jgi:hypothetical protein|nr:T9SS type A sorting domain-containing protein [Bacteroidales bacterium]
MRKTVLFAAFFVFLNTLSHAQNRGIARGAEPGELYFTGLWYGIGDVWNYVTYDTVRTALYRLTENGKKLTVQCSSLYLSDNPEYVITPDYILADATPGAIYNRQTFTKNSYTHTALWVSFDYGKNWTLREKNIGSVNYFSTNYEGMIYRSGPLKSTDYGTTFISVEGGIGSQGEFGWEEKEIFAGSTYNGYDGILYHTYDLYKSYIEIPIDSQFMFGLISGVFPDVYRGGIPGEVYISSWFPDWTFKVSFSADTGYTFRHAYISEVYDPYNSYINMPVFMSDREPGVFYIINTSYIDDYNPLGWYLKMCIEYYRDYGETLEATFCHDITKDYKYEEVICDNSSYLDSKMVNPNSVLLQWSNSADNSFIRGYHVYRNNLRITNTLLADTTYLDENLPNGDYEYYIRTYYKEGCVSDSSNHVEETIDLGIKEFEDGIVVFPNPTTGELQVTSYELRVMGVEIFDVYGRTITTHYSLLTTHYSIDISELHAGIYFVRIATERGPITKKIIKY